VQTPSSYLAETLLDSSSYLDDSDELGPTKIIEERIAE
jgi:hypothetical protein